MASFFLPGELKIRPGLYKRYQNVGNPPVAGADDGRCAAVFRSNWGPLIPTVLTTAADVERIYGDGGDDGTTAVALEEFRGGARTVAAVRLGTGGTQGTLTLYDTSATAVSVATITMLYPGSRAFSVTIRPDLRDSTLNEFLLLEGTTVLERFTFPIDPPEGQAAALVAATARSRFFTMTAESDNTVALATLTQEPITPGTDPTVDVTAYTAAFEALESANWSVLAIDTTDPATHSLTQGFVNRVYAGGMNVMCVIGEDSSVDFDDRLTNAAAFNDYQVVYIITGYNNTAGEKIEGYLAAARIAGMIAATPSNEAITRLTIAGAASVSENLTNYQLEQAILNGAIAFSTADNNTVQVDSGVNTLVSLSTNMDEGWKKIKRVKVRFELFDRIARTIAPIAGRVNNDPNGRANVIQLGNNVMIAMVAESKLLQGASLELDPDNPPVGDKAWFVANADDIDTLEQLYFTFNFRYSPEN